MDAHELHGELFDGEGAFDLGLLRHGDTIAVTVVRDAGVEGARVQLPMRQARAAWFHLGELCGYDDVIRERVEQRARDLAREWIRMDENATRELAILRERAAREAGTQLG